MKILPDLFVGSLIGLCFFGYWYQIPSRDFFYFCSILWNPEALIDLKSYNVDLLAFSVTVLGTIGISWIITLGVFEFGHTRSFLRFGIFINQIVAFVIFIPYITFVLSHKFSGIFLLVITIGISISLMVTYSILSILIARSIYSDSPQGVFLPTAIPILLAIAAAFILLPPNRHSPLEIEIIQLQSTATQQAINSIEAENAAIQNATSTSAAENAIATAASREAALLMTRDALAAQVNSTPIPNNSAQSTNSPAPTNTPQPSNTPSPTERIVATPSPDVEGTTIALQATQTVIERQSPEENPDLIRDSGFQFTIGTIIGLIGVFLAMIQVWQGFKR